jgi:hypothetical protein
VQPIGLGAELPTNVHLLSVEYLDSTKEGHKNVAIRLAHQFAVNEDADMSVDVQVDLSSLFSTFGSIQSVTEMSLSMNQLKADLVNNKVAWKTADGAVTASSTSTTVNTASRSLRSTTGLETVVTLNPMQIKTFVVTFSR